MTHLRGDELCHQVHEVLGFEPTLQLVDAMLDRPWREVKVFGDFLGRLPLDQQLDDVVIRHVGLCFFRRRNKEPPFDQTDTPVRPSLALLRKQQSLVADPDPENLRSDKLKRRAPDLQTAGIGWDDGLIDEASIEIAKDGIGKLQLELGQSVTVFSPRFGMAAGVAGIVISLAPDWNTGRVKVGFLV